MSQTPRQRYAIRRQRTMIVAKRYPEPQKGGRGKKSVLITEFSAASLSHARLVLKVLPELADAVIKGDNTLGDNGAVRLSSAATMATWYSSTAAIDALPASSPA